MKYYFNWVAEEAVFHSDAPLQEDEVLFSLRITEEEGALPQARIVVENRYRDTSVASAASSVAQERRHCFIVVSQEGQAPRLLFRGRLVNCPTSLQGEFMTLDFIALSKAREANYEALLNDLQNTVQYDDLLLPLAKRAVPCVTDLLSAQNQLVHWDRTSHDVVLSELTKGRYHGDLVGAYYRDSLQLALVTTPLEDVEVHLHAKWVQRFQGATRLDSVFQRALNGGVIETYSGQDLEKNWWHADQQVHQNGYRVMESDLKELPALTQTNRFWVSPEDPVLKKRGSRRQGMGPQEPQKLSLKRKGFRPSLKLGWRYVQPRHEEVVFTLKHDVQSLAYKPAKRKVLNLHVYDLVASEQLAHWGADLYYKRGERLEHQGQVYEARRSHRSGQNFEQDEKEWASKGSLPHYPLQAHRGTFFQTDRGRQVIDNALAQAQAHLCASARCVEISVACPLEQALSWSCDHSLTLRDERLPGGGATGKVKKLTFEVLGETGRTRAYVTVACCVGTGSVPLVAEAQDQAKALLEDGIIEGLSRPHSPVTYSFSQGNESSRGLMYPALFGASDLLREVSVNKGAKEQEDTLLASQYPHSSNIMAGVGGAQTKVKLRLEDLRGRRLEKNTYHLDIARPWSAPQQITLGEE